MSMLLDDLRNNAEFHWLIGVAADEIERLETAISELRAEAASIMQAITDPENQPSQFGTVTLEWHEKEMRSRIDGGSHD